MIAAPVPAPGTSSLLLVRPPSAAADGLAVTFATLMPVADVAGDSLSPAMPAPAATGVERDKAVLEPRPAVIELADLLDRSAGALVANPSAATREPTPQPTHAAQPVRRAHAPLDASERADSEAPVPTFDPLPGTPAALPQALDTQPAAPVVSPTGDRLQRLFDPALPVTIASYVVVAEPARHVRSAKDISVKTAPARAERTLAGTATISSSDLPGGSPLRITETRGALLFADRPELTPTASTVPGAVPTGPNFQVTTTADASVVTIERHLDLARGDAWLDDLARDIAATANGGGRLKFALMPETLGRLDVEVRREDAGVHVHLAARSETARDALAAAQPRIAEEIRAHGVRVAGTEVSAGLDSERGQQNARPAALIETALSAALASDAVSVRARKPSHAPAGRFA